MNFLQKSITSFNISKEASGEKKSCFVGDKKNSFLQIVVILKTLFNASVILSECTSLS